MGPSATKNSCGSTNAYGSRRPFLQSSPNESIMASPVPSPRIEISDLMEATFWEANKAKIGIFIGVVAGSVLVWQGWRAHQESKQEAGWNALLDPSTMGIREDVSLSSDLDGSSAAPWARLAIARNAFQDKDYARAEAVLEELRSRGELPAVDHGGVVTALATDASAEKSFRASHPEPSKPSPTAQQPQFEITTDAGSISIQPYGDAESVFASQVLSALRDGKLANLRFDDAMSGQELSAKLDPGVVSFEGSQSSWTTLRTNKVISNYEGTIAVRLVAPTNPEDPTTYELVFNLSDNGMRDSDSIVVASVTSGLELLKTVSERDADDAGKLKEPLRISAIAEKS